MPPMSDSARAIAEATAVFEKDVGDWDAEVVIQPGPGAAPIRQTGRYQARLTAGRWLVVDYQTDSGFQGHGVYGWDPARGKYVGSWVDSLQVSIARSEGTWDAATRTMTFVTEAAAASGGTLRYREITQTEADGTQVYRNLVPVADGGELELVRTVYRRRA